MKVISGRWRVSQPHQGSCQPVHLVGSEKAHFIVQISLQGRDSDARMACEQRNELCTVVTVQRLQVDLEKVPVDVYGPLPRPRGPRQLWPVARTAAALFLLAGSHSVGGTGDSSGHQGTQTHLFARSIKAATRARTGAFQKIQPLDPLREARHPARIEKRQQPTHRHRLMSTSHRGKCGVCVAALSGHRAERHRPVSAQPRQPEGQCSRARGLRGRGQFAGLIPSQPCSPPRGTDAVLVGHAFGAWACRCRTSPTQGGLASDEPRSRVRLAAGFDERLECLFAGHADSALRH